MNFFVLTLFPEAFHKSLDYSILKRAQDKGLVNIEIFNIRNFAKDKHKTTDLPPYGGGPGMLLKVEPIFRGVRYVQKKYGLKKKNSRVILLSAAGKLYNQEKAIKYSKLKNLVLICGHYEGVDERVAKYVADEEISIGNYILSGGEPAAIVIIDSTTRLISGVVENEKSIQDESFTKGFVEYPQYTRPKDFEGLKVPKILLSGNHAKIEKWKKEQATRKTIENRPDLLKK